MSRRDPEVDAREQLLYEAKERFPRANRQLSLEHIERHGFGVEQASVDRIQTIIERFHVELAAAVKEAKLTPLAAEPAPFLRIAVDNTAGVMGT